MTTPLEDDKLVKSLQTSFHRKPLNFPQRAYKLANIDLDSLIHQGIRGVILDLDNTIVSEDDRYLSPGAETWIEAAKRAGIRLFILSNGKRRHRMIYWSARLNLPAISPARKPFPKSFRKAIDRMGLTASQVIVIGDSRHTDILGAWLVGCASIQVATLPHPFRWWERLFGKWVQSPYPYHHELWDFVE